MDHLHIDDLLVSATHGHYEAEWSTEQRFRISLRVGFDSHAAGKTDTLADTIDYDALKEIVQGVLAADRRYLIEKLAADIAERILRDQRALEAMVTIRKLDAWENGVPGVTITRAR
ncbi:MAG TPA: dihydroneopterin aldolase [Candidatus Paceibacterota bacterium]|jgi:dihydroneopterin aldolase|nr:dihydroneopterin aldolase [Candidatus Paceibacterota bacterium]